MICGSAEFCCTSELLFFGIFMIEQRRVEGLQARPSDLFGTESQSWLIKKNASYC